MFIFASGEDGIVECPEGFEEVGNQCLLFNEDDTKTWSDASFFCGYMDADLLVIPNKNAQDQLMKYAQMRSINATSFWIGGFLDSNAQWQWKDGTVDVLTNLNAK